MLVPSVPKIKKLVGDIKSRWLDNDEAINDPEGTYCALLKVELVLRGAIVEDDDKLWGAVLSSVGKPLLDNKSIPKPLISAANIIAGKLAEQLFKIMHLFNPMLAEASGPTKRAQDLKDRRLLALLRQDFDPLEVAKGYFLRAAEANPEKPAMWRQVFDVMILQHADEAPFEAQTIIAKLVKIALSKGNVKRSEELRLKLCLSYLNTDRTVAKESLSVIFAGSNSHHPEKDLLKVAQWAKSSLHESPFENLDDMEKKMYKILCLRVELAVEDAKIETMAEERYQASRNRSNTTSMTSFRSICKEEVLSRPEDPVEEASFAVRDVLLSTLSAGSSSLLPTCIEWTQNALSRFKARAQLNKSNVGWKILIAYIRPIIDDASSAILWNIHLPQNERQTKINNWFSQTPLSIQSMLLSIAYMLPLTYWMLLPYSLEPMTETLQFLLDAITCTHITDDKVSPGLSQKNKSIIDAEKKLAKSMIQCFLCTGKADHLFEIFQEAVANKSRKTKVPLGHLQCLVSWSGWYQPSWSLYSRFGDVRPLLTASRLDAGRTLSSLEEVLFDLAHADAELLQGGSVQRACDRYQKVLANLEKGSIMDEGLRNLFQSHCNNGLANTCRRGATVLDNKSVEQFASTALRILEVNHPVAPFHIWHDPASASSAYAYQLSVARQLIADSLVAKGNCEEAQVILEAAVRDSPDNASAALSLGAFLLRVAFFINTKRSEKADKQALVHLLKAAKLDPSQARPFALLGFWFEEKGDSARAKGCYSKCLANDPCDPVAGRGILRLETNLNSQKYIDAALAQNSRWNGWAWTSVGLQKTMVGEDELALVALLKAARCRDIRKAHDSIHLDRVHDIFYQQDSDRSNEEVVVYESIGLCYRRLGRYTAAMRAFHLAIELSKAEKLAAISVLCSCAQVELELALFEEAAEKFAEILRNKESGDFQSIAAYGQGVALLSLAERDLRDGKAGSAFSKVTKAIGECLRLSGEFSCIYKLLGDLYSFGALIPSPLFDNGHCDDADTMHNSAVKKQLEFVSCGEAAYQSALTAIETCIHTDQSIASHASYRCDIASNILLQAKLVASTCEVGRIDSLCKSIYKKAANEFESLLSLSPISAVAWCGFGCAVDDPLLAQHAFCRSLQIERLLPDGYTNIGFLYTKLHALSASEETMHVLTQVADTPLMWVNRAFVLEQKSSDCLEATTDDLTLVIEASDAYRAALQVTKQPDALIGLAATEMLSSYGRLDVYANEKKNTLALLNEYLAMSCNLRKEAQLLAGLVGMEQAALAQGARWRNEEVEKGRGTCKRVLSYAGETKWVNSGIMEKCLQKPKARTPQRKRDASHVFGTQAKIIGNPNDPIQWLTLAKNVAKKVDITSSKEMVGEAIRMAEKASDVLTQNMTSPHVIDKSRNVTEANTVAEALSLLCSLRRLYKDNGWSNIPLGYDLQHAMMMSPDSKLVRVLLQCNLV